MTTHSLSIALAAILLVGLAAVVVFAACYFQALVDSENEDEE